MAGNGGTYLYRLLRDDEYPLTDGIMAKYPSRDKEPSYHIRQCSSEYKACHWISTCASKDALWKMVDLKTRKYFDDEGDNDICVRYAIIDRSELETYAKICNEREACEDYTYVLEVFEDRIVRTIPFREQTGRILDFTDPNVMEKYLPSAPDDKKYQIQRNYAKKYEEVLVERFIPPHCCIEVIPRDKIPRLFKNEIEKKEFVSLHEWNDRCRSHFEYSRMFSVTEQMRATHISGNVYQPLQPWHPPYMPSNQFYLPT